MASGSTGAFGIGPRLNNASNTENPFWIEVVALGLPTSFAISQSST